MQTQGNDVANVVWVEIADRPEKEPPVHQFRRRPGLRYLCRAMSCLIQSVCFHNPHGKVPGSGVLLKTEIDGAAGLSAAIPL